MRSDLLKKGINRAPARAMLKATGLTDADLERPLIAVANTWTMAWLWFPCLLMWVIKGLVLRYGGLRLYRQWMPFFLGLILGDYLAGALWAILGAVLDIKIYRIFVI